MMVYMRFSRPDCGCAGPRSVKGLPGPHTEPDEGEEIHI